MTDTVEYSFGAANLVRYYNQAEFSDVTILLPDEVTIRAHKLILASSSEFFAKRFHFTSLTKAVEPDVVDLRKEPYESEVLQVLLEFCYSGKLELPKYDRQLPYYVWLNGLTQLFITMDYLGLSATLELGRKLAMENSVVLCFFEDHAILQRIQREAVKCFNKNTQSTHNFPVTSQLLAQIGIALTPSLSRISLTLEDISSATMKWIMEMYAYQQSDGTAVIEARCVRFYRYWVEATGKQVTLPPEWRAALVNFNNQKQLSEYAYRSLTIREPNLGLRWLQQDVNLNKLSADPLQNLVEKTNNLVKYFGRQDEIALTTRGFLNILARPAEYLRLPKAIELTMKFASAWIKGKSEAEIDAELDGLTYHVTNNQLREAWAAMLNNRHGS